MADRILAIATMNTKGEELDFVAQRMRRAGCNVATVDVSTRGESPLADVPACDVAAAHPDGADRVYQASDRGEAVTAMGVALRSWMVTENDAGRVAGVIALGGSGGTAMVAPALQSLPIGVPKLIVSTVASGNTEPYVGTSDITMMYSVVDVAGMNAVSQRILSNAAHAMVGMTSQGERPSTGKRAIGMTMFGVTTPCVDLVRRELEKRGYDALVFHATGTGGRAMEKLVADDLIEGVLDVTTTEVADHLVGGVMSCGPDRFDAILAREIPFVLSLGAVDMVNFGARDTVPERFANRNLVVHNPQVTLMRTTVDENREIARWIAAKLNRSTAPLEILIPEHGVSMLDALGQPFRDAEADRALFETLEQQVELSPSRIVTRHPLHINDPAFASALVEAFTRISEGGRHA